MTAQVVEVGPETVHGPGSAPQQHISAALEYVDDQIALLDDRVVDVDGLWREVLGAAAAGAEGAVVIVVPTWWLPYRVEVVTAAAEAVFAEVVVVQRSILARDSDATVIELSAEYVVVTPPASDSLVLARDAPEVEVHLTASCSVLVDVPAGVRPLPAAVTARLRRLGIPLAHNARHRLRAAAAEAIPQPRRGADARPSRRAIAVLAGLALTAGAAGGGWAAKAFTAETGPGTATRLLTEGRIAVRVPGAWGVERITAGAGSARVRIAAPGGLPALHVTQSAGTAEASLEEVAETLRQAMASEPAGVFADFDPAGDRGGRPAVTYVERRAGTETRWAVFVDGAMRIAIGCQHTTTRGDLIDDVCSQAVRSAHAVP